MTRWLGHCTGCGNERQLESRSRHAMKALCDECAAKPYVRPPAPPEGASVPGRRQRGGARGLVAMGATGMAFEQVHWLWRQYVALGKVTVLAGLAGQGKSQLTCMVAAIASRGWGDAPAGDVLVVSGEDDPKDTIGPRCAAAGVDFQRLFLLDARVHEEDGTTSPTTLMMPDDAKGLRGALAGLMSPRLLILDPVTAFLSSHTDSHKNADVRSALGPLKQLAEDFGLAVLLVTHLNKSSGVEPLVRIADSGAFTALARGVLLMAPDPEDEEGDRGRRKVMALAKANLADTGEHSLRFLIKPTQATDDHGTTVDVVALELLGRSPLSAHDLLIPRHERAALDEARIFLRDLLDDHWERATDVKKAARSDFISESTLRRAREVECQRPRKLGTGKAAWWWALQGTEWDGDPEASRARARGAMNGGPLDHLPHQDDQGVRDNAPPARARAREGVVDLEAVRRETARRLGEREDDDA